MPIDKFGKSEEAVTYISSTSTSTSIGVALPRVSNTFLWRDGSNAVKGNINVNNHKPTNINETSADDNAVNKKYVDDTAVSKTGDILLVT